MIPHQLSQVSSQLLQRQAGQLTQEGVQLDFEAPSNNTQEDAQEAIEAARETGAQQPEEMAPDNGGDQSTAGSKY